MMTMGEYRGQFNPVQEMEQARFWIGTAAKSLWGLNHERRIIEQLLGCFPAATVSAVRELQQELDEKVTQIMELEEKVANLDKDCQNMVQEQIALKIKSRALKKEHDDTL
jgi:hypothetical protein